VTAAGRGGAGAAIEIRRLSFGYPGGGPPVFRELTLAIPAGARCLLLGANGVGKSTLLRLIGGRHMIPEELVRVLGRPAFHDTRLSGEVGFLGGDFPFHHDITVGEILGHRPGVDPARRARVVEILDVDPGWRMHQVSDGQRRRVQILLELERTLSVVLLDEVTADLDVLARADLLRFLRAESEQRSLTVVYASHVLDGLQAWATHLVFLGRGRVRWAGAIDQLPELRAIPADGEAASPLHQLCERWMAEDRRDARGGQITDAV
jgi:CCR4-NOT complex subunit CAF16